MAKKKSIRKEIILSEGSGNGIVRSSYDSAKTTVNNENHWKNADFLSPVQENSRAKRRILVNRARYETYNNCYGLGTVFSVAESVVGEGIRLYFDSGNETIDELLSEKWEEQCEAINMQDKLQLMELAEMIDGESFPVFQNNPELETDSKLDINLIPTERVASPEGDGLATDVENTPNNVDGIQFDRYGNIVSLTVLNTHPSEADYRFNPNDVTVISSKYSAHYFVSKRVGEKRQVPRITPALPIFAQLRRWTLATLDSAETAANISAVLQTDAPADGEMDYVKPMDILDIAKNSMMTLPFGYKIGQLKAEQPISGYSEFKNELLLEAVRCILMPRGIAKGDSSDYNYASGRLDKQQWEKSICIRRKRIYNIVLKKYVKLWLDELEFSIPKLRNLRKNGALKVEAFWDGEFHVDPVKEANADMQNLANRTDTLKAICARNGDDYRKVLKQLALEKKLLDKYGLSVEEVLVGQNESKPVKKDSKNAKAKK